MTNPFTPNPGPGPSGPAARRHELPVGGPFGRPAAPPTPAAGPGSAAPYPGAPGGGPAAGGAPYPGAAPMPAPYPPGAAPAFPGTPGGGPAGFGSPYPGAGAAPGGAPSSYSPFPTGRTAVPGALEHRGPFDMPPTPPVFGVAPTPVHTRSGPAGGGVRVPRPTTVIVASSLLWLCAALCLAQLVRIILFISSASDLAVGISRQDPTGVVQTTAVSWINQAESWAIYLVSVCTIFATLSYIVFGISAFRGRRWPRVAAVVLAVFSLAFLIGFEPVSVTIVILGIAATVLLWMPDSLVYSLKP
ncbi:MAG: hypothetical protein QM809_04455 [Gordonia sp. (in: high G+C Gram-positive bacteria)]|uniref:hypothetical protein n=1 Tax=Gordonia sp. (in: high G+C Gram-positive bacteria) TaxID=84139 RepID=UPI0039E37161